MEVYLITYTLNGPKQNYAALYAYFDAIKAHEVATSSRVVAISYDAKTLCEALLKFTDANDVICVVGVSAWATREGTPLANWFKANFRR